MLNVVIFAAGHGTRMKTELPKVLHTIAGRPMLAVLIDAILPLKPSKVIITCSYKKDLVMQAINILFPEMNFEWVEQKEVLGTAQAMKCVLPNLDHNADCLVMCGDMPFIQDEISHEIITTKILEDFINFHQQSANHMTIMSNFKHNPMGYGRIVRKPIHMFQEVSSKNMVCNRHVAGISITHDDVIVAIREQKNLAVDQKDIKEVNTGVYMFNTQLLQDYIPQILPNEISGEYYLTDIVELVRESETDNIKNKSIGSFILPENIFFAGANSQLQLTEIERKYQMAFASALLKSGVRLYDVNRIDIRGRVIAGTDCIIDVNCIFEGQVVLGDNVHIGTGCYLKNIKIANNTVIKPYSVLEDAVIGDQVQIGPFARIRPGTTLEDNSRVGNFVEIKNTKLGNNSKVNHLSYIGDAVVGSNVNIGAGVVVCNYDGINKHKTEIGNDVFVGSGTMLVAPLEIGNDALIAAGSTINKNVPAHELTIARAKQETKFGWLEKSKKGKK